MYGCIYNMKMEGSTYYFFVAFSYIFFLNSHQNCFVMLITSGEERDNDAMRKHCQNELNSICSFFLRYVVFPKINIKTNN